jgi:hypothetical protein
VHDLPDPIDPRILEAGGLAAAGGECTEHPMRSFHVCLVASTLIACTSCCGTLVTRGNGTLFGAYPLMAVWADLELMQRIGGETERLSDVVPITPLMSFFGGLLSLPIDIALDVVALPVDLTAWAFGNHKDDEISNPSRRAKPRGTLFEQEMLDLYEKLEAEKVQRDKAR